MCGNGVVFAPSSTHDTSGTDRTAYDSGYQSIFLATVLTCLLLSDADRLVSSGVGDRVSGPEHELPPVELPGWRRADVFLSAPERRRKRRM